MFHLGNKSLLELRNPSEDLYVHPLLCNQVEEAIIVTPVDFSVHDGLRTILEQKEYMKAGVSKTLRSYHIPGIRRSHGRQTMYGQAVDLVPYINGKLRWEWEPIYLVVGAMHECLAVIGSSNKIRWGGVWDRTLDQLDPNDLAGERDRYVERRRQAGRKAFTDGPHLQIEIHES